MSEADLFPPLKKYFQELGYKVYAEVPLRDGCVDFVAVKNGEHIAVEMKLHFTNQLVSQGSRATSSFHKVYVAFPVKNMSTEPSDRGYMRRRYSWCESYGIGIFQVLPFGNIFTMLEARKTEPKSIYDFSTFRERKKDIAGLRSVKNSLAKVVVSRVKNYVRKNPNADWKEIYSNVQNHYSSRYSMISSMGVFQDFSLDEYSKKIKASHPEMFKEEDETQVPQS